MHRCVKFHDTEYAVYGDADEEVGAPAEEVDEARDEEKSAEEEEGADSAEEGVVGSAMETPTEAAGGDGAGSADHEGVRVALG